MSSVVSFSGGDLFLSFLPEFRAKSESEARPLPCSFHVRSLADFVGDLPDELLFCPVRALRVSLDRIVSLPSCPRTLFVSPCAPSRSLSKNALSFFLRSVIADSYSSAGLSLLVVSSSSSSSCCFFVFFLFLVLSSSFFRSCSWGSGCRGVLGIPSYPLSSVLEAATWSSASIFTSFYLSDVQFSSSQGFSLGPVVAAGAVV